LEKQTDIRFDNYTDNYKHKIQDSIDFIGQDVDFFIEIKARMLLELAGRYVGKTETIDALDIGCGIGLVDKLTAKHFKSLTGIDVEEGVIEKAKINNPGVNYLNYDGKRIPFEDHSFHLVFAINVIHHIPVEQWQSFVNEMRRVLKPGGMAAVFEHNPANPLTRKVVRECEFDRDAVLLPHNKIKELCRSSGLRIVDNAYVIFFPFRGRIFRVTEKFLKRLLLGAQQYVAALK
jgi:ubiquinone/menaquinone biosynthesis C-methylase UbiE